jgi:hypothetical protein
VTLLEVRREGVAGRIDFGVFSRLLESIPDDGPGRAIRRTREGRLAAKVWEPAKNGRLLVERAMKLEARRREALYIDLQDGKVVTPPAFTHRSTASSESSLRMGARSSGP